MSKNKEHQKEANKLRKRLSKRKKLIIGIAVVVVMIAIATGAWFFIQTRQLSTPVVARTTDQIGQIVTDANALADNGDVTGAKKAYDTAVAQTTDPAQKQTLLAGDAAVYYNDGDYDKALALAKQSEAISLDSGLASFIAEIYRNKGDKQNAISYYQKAISLTDKINSADDFTEYYQNEINILNGATN
ncbi:MAG: tetratricopeptide repeat protein [Candidatus Saccharibacteria bacterium]